MSTSRVAAARALVAAKLKASKEAIAENQRLKALLASKQDELKDLKELWTQLQSGESALEEENKNLLVQVDKVEGEIIEILAKIEGEGDEPEPQPKPQPKPQVKQENKKNGKVLPPEDGGSPWLPLEDPEDNTEMVQVKGRWRIDLTEEGLPEAAFPTVEFWGPLVGVIPSYEEATHYRVAK